MNTKILALVLAGSAAAWRAPLQATSETAPEPADGSTESTFYWGDFDADGLPDAIAIAGGEARLLQNLGDGTFRDASREVGLPRLQQVAQAAWGDFDADGRLDLFLSSATGGHLLRNAEDGTFADVTRRMALDATDVSGAHWIDYDADGRLDLHVSTPSHERLFHNEGGAFSEVELEIPSNTRGVGGSLDSAGAEVTGEGETATAADRGLEDRDQGGSSSLTLGGSSSSAGSADELCVSALRDQATGYCLDVSSIPTFGELYPLGPEFNIDAAGNVGIGTLPSGARLDVDLRANEIARFGRSGASSEVQCTNGRLRSDNNRFQILGQHQSGAPRTITFGQSDGDYDVTIDVNGRVGIGTSTPSSRLDVDGTVHVNGPVDTPANVTANRLNLTATTGAPFTVASSDRVIGLNADLLDGLDSSAFSQFGALVNTNEIANDAVTSAKLGHDLALVGDLAVDSTTLFVDASTNRVGVGTASPSVALDVNGDIEAGDDFFVGDDLDVDGAADLAGGQIELRLNADNAGFVETKGPNGNANVRLSSITGYPNRGAITVFDANGVAQAGLQVNSSGDGLVWGDVKNFVADNPDDPDTHIWYASLEGPEAAAYVRGTAQLVDGEVTIELPRHFQNVSSEQDLTALVTPLSAASRGLAVVEKSRQRIVVRERMGGRGNYAVDWEVKAVRRGFEDYEVVRSASLTQTSTPMALQQDG